MEGFQKCIVPKSLTLYTLDWFMGKRNKAVKLTRRKIKYIIRSKINNKSTKRIASEMKVSISSVRDLDVLARQSRGGADKEIRRRKKLIVKNGSDNRNPQRAKIRCKAVGKGPGIQIS